MQIFVSWSGKPAQVLADFLQTWLRQVIQELDPFMSTNSIEKGARWSPEIAKRLEQTGEAIVCVTSENKDAPWLNFEAGALAKATESRVRPLLIGLAPSDVTGPLSEFQLTSATDKDDVRRLLTSINERCDRSLPGTILDATFNREWPTLEAKVTEVIAMIGGQPGKTQRKRGDADLMAEILERVRMMERLGQEQMFMSERIFDAFQRREGSRAVPLEARGRLIPTSTKSIKATQAMYEQFQIAMGRSVALLMSDRREVEGKLVGLEGELPDVAVSIKTDSQSDHRELVPLSGIQDFRIYPPADDDEPPF